VYFVRKMDVGKTNAAFEVGIFAPLRTLCFQFNRNEEDWRNLPQWNI